MPGKTEYPITDEMQERLDNDFTYHAPTPDQIERYQQIREGAKAFATLIMQLTPSSAEQTLSKRAIETAVFWANSAIARNENGDPDED